MTASLLWLLLALPGSAFAQDTAAMQTIKPGEHEGADFTGSSTESEIPGVPRLSSALHGLNGGMTISALHDSVTGWATYATPAISYAFSDRFSADATIPIYFYRLAESLAAKPKPNAELIKQRGELADLILAAHMHLAPDLFEYQATGALSVPTGDEPYGLTTGRVTFDIDNHFNRTFGRLTPTLSLGGGDSASLVNRLVVKNYTSLGPLAHFQVGLGVALFHGIAFESDAYEQMPIGDQKIYGPSRKGQPNIVIGHNVSEDNGFTNSLDIPVDRHTTLSAYYNRSLRVHTDTVSLAVTYVLRPPPLEVGEAMDELFR